MEIAFTSQECKDIIELYLNGLNLKGQDLNLRTSRAYSYYTLEANNKTNWIFERLKKFFVEETEIELYGFPTTASIHSYVENEYFSRHSDQKYTLYSVGACLNEDYEGGEFVLYQPDFILPKKEGALYYFDSRRQHEIKKITKGTRWSLISFITAEHLGFTNKSQLI